MKFEIKSLVIAAALVAAGTANAAVTCNNGTVTAKVGIATVVCDPGLSGRFAELTVISGGGALSFSNGITPGVQPKAVSGLVAALNVGKVALNPLDGAVVDQSNVLLTTGKTVRGTVSIAATVNTLVANGTTGQIENVFSTGGAEQVAAPLPDVLDGGRMTVRNLRFDLAGKAVYADITGQALGLDGVTYAPLETLNNVQVWTIGTITGPTSLSPAGLLAAASGDFSVLQGAGYELLSTGPGVNPLYTVKAHDVFENLQVTTAGFNAFSKYLGLTEGSLGYDTLAGVNAKAGGWGSITSDIVFTAREVPEPSTYALMGLGLVGISLVARRRAK